MLENKCICIAHQVCNCSPALWAVLMKRGGCELSSAVAGTDEGAGQTCNHGLPLLN